MILCPPEMGLLCRKKLSGETFRPCRLVGQDDADALSTR